MPGRLDDQQQQFPRRTGGPAICTDQNVRVEDYSLAAVPRVFDGFVDCSLDFVGRNVTDLFGAAVKKCFKSPRNASAAFGRRDVLQGKSGHADLFVRSNRAAQQLFHRRPHGVRQIAGSLY